MPWGSDRYLCTCCELEAHATRNCLKRRHSAPQLATNERDPCGGNVGVYPQTFQCQSARGSSTLAPRTSTMLEYDSSGDHAWPSAEQQAQAARCGLADPSTMRMLTHTPTQPAELATAAKAPVRGQRHCGGSNAFPGINDICSAAGGARCREQPNLECGHILQWSECAARGGRAVAAVCISPDGMGSW